jgi:hypothetical protein
MRRRNKTDQFLLNVAHTCLFLAACIAAGMVSYAMAQSYMIGG